MKGARPEIKATCSVTPLDELAGCSEQATPQRQKAESRVPGALGEKWVPLLTGEQFLLRVRKIFDVDHDVGDTEGTRIHQLAPFKWPKCAAYESQRNEAEPKWKGVGPQRCWEGRREHLSPSPRAGSLIREAR